jgi:phage FluMu protein Com
MRGVRCQRCSKMFSLSRDLVVTALEEVEQKGEDYYTVECPNCRHAVKVPRRDLERMRPREQSGEQKVQ